MKLLRIFNARFDDTGSRKVNTVYNISTSRELETGGRIHLKSDFRVNGGSYTLENVTSGIAKKEAVAFLTKLFNNVKALK